MVSQSLPQPSFALWHTIVMKVRYFLLLGFLLLLTGIRWWFGANLELTPDESYHFQWAQHPDVSYYSNGPGVALAILAGTSLFGPTEFGVRFFSPLLGLCTSLLVYLLGRKLSREKVAFWSVVGLNLLPLFNVESVAPHCRFVVHLFLGGGSLPFLARHRAQPEILHFLAR